MSKRAGPIETVGALSEALKGFSPDTRIFGTEVTGLSIHPQKDGALLVANHRSDPLEKAVPAS